MIYLVFFAIVYSIKGGVLERFKNYDRVAERSKILAFLLGGKFLSTLMVLLFGLMMFPFWWQAVALAIAWLIAVAPSMGEEHGAIGYFTTRFWRLYDNKKDAFIGCFIELDGYNKTHRGRIYDIKKGFQRGVWMGAFMAVAMTSLVFIPLSLLFVPLVFIGQTLNRLILKRDGWTLAEPLIGAVLFGVPFIA